MTDFRTRGRGSTRKVFPLMTGGKQIPEYLQTLDPASEEYYKIRSQLPPPRELSEKARRERQRFHADQANLPLRQNSDRANPNLSTEENLHQGNIGYNGWWNHDTWETFLILGNTEQTERWLRRDWKGSWERKMKSGRFDRDEAKFAIWKYIIPVAQGRGVAKSRFKLQEGEFDADIDRSKVNIDEILDAILED